MLRLLIVEDDPLQLDCLSELLRGAGYQVDGASSGTTAVSMLQTTSYYDAVILDVCLSGLPGTEVLHLIRSLRGYERLPVVVTSGLPAEDLTELAAQPHVAVLQKQFSLADVMRALTTLAERRS